MVDPAPVPLEEPLAELERTLIDEYIVRAGFNPRELLSRNDDASRLVRCAAANYAACRLSEVEARLHYLRSLRGQE
jgi:hypothetical protein